MNQRTDGWTHPLIDLNLAEFVKRMINLIKKNTLYIKISYKNPIKDYLTI